MIPILFEDEHWLVLDKPAGVVVNQTETSPEPSLVERFADRDARVVHRLDRDTTGVMVLGKGKAAAAQLSAAFAERRVRKQYWAIVEGPGLEGVLEAKIGKDRRRPRARAVRDDGQSAKTTVEVRGRRGELSWLQASPHTGRTHQIRVHLAHAGQPIVGDTLYGGPAAVRLDARVERPGRPLLHARELVLPTPDGQEMRFVAPLPADLARFVEAMGGAEPERPTP